MDEVKSEIRQMLLGNLVRKDKYLEVSTNKYVGFQYGMADGADNILVLGVMKHTRYYKTTLKANRIREIGHKALMEVGRKVYLKSNPNAETALCKYLVTRPIVVLFEVDDLGVKVETYTGRGILGLVSEWWVRRKFMKFMPKDLEKISNDEIFKKTREDRIKKEAEEKEAEEARKAEEETRKALEAAKEEAARAEEEAKEAAKEAAERERREAEENLKRAEEEAAKAEEEARKALERARKAKEEAERARTLQTPEAEFAESDLPPKMSAKEFDEDFNYEDEEDDR